MKVKTKWIVGLFLVFFSIQVIVLSDFFNDRAYLTNLLEQIAVPNSPPSEQVKGILNFMRERPVITNENYFLLPIFSFLRPTARQVAENGGDCADLSRLLIRLLQLRNIKASKWALYNNDQKPLHAVVEVEVETGKMVVDVLFKFWFPRQNFGYYGIQELRENPELLPTRIFQLRSQDSDPMVKRYPLNQYIYNNVRTINWDKSHSMQLLYRIVHSFIGEEVNEINRPSIVESPALMIFWGMVGGEGIILILWFFPWEKRLRREN